MAVRTGKKPLPLRPLDAKVYIDADNGDRKAKNRIAMYLLRSKRRDEEIRLWETDHGIVEHYNHDDNANHGDAYVNDDNNDNNDDDDEQRYV